ncbi:LacI family transcriptional regulator [Streptosporangium album]|uniref:LacI family transcriptional regulator n=1 Tax=Streptosporangium album TaxID=47479 RepID=A0A7W7WDT9_9ACTN|nr:LacI family DNA-binding transcriptional regulator [Streptosporangium album]MBB4943198.1 LacI family transcriptional regulator [Streptosporangium album]
MAAQRGRATGRPPTMKDVAALAGVGLATVSRVINGTPVDPVLTAQVTEAAKQLGYRHDPTASSLRRSDRRTRTVGLILEDVANPFSSLLHRAVEDVTSELGLLLLAGSSDEDPERERSLLGAFHARRVDGLIVVPTGQVNDELQAVRRQGMPIVCVDRAAELDGVDTVTVDNAGGVGDAVRRLHALGHREIAFLGDQVSLWTAQRRWEGFVATMAALACPLREGWVRRDLHGEAAGERAAREVLTGDTLPTALVTSQNLLTIGARYALQDLGLQHTVAHVGFDDFELANLLSPPLSVIAQDPKALGRRASELLLSRLDGYEGPERHVVLPTRYVARGSGEITRPRPGRGDTAR